MGRVIAAITGLIGAGLSIPLVGYVVSPALQRRPTSLFKAGSISDLTPGQAKEMGAVVEWMDGWIKTRATRAVWVVKKQAGELRVYNPHCTHLGCAYHWDREERLFKCPCHGGVYDMDGRVLSGPPPRSLDTMEFHIEGGDLFVHYQDFRAGAVEKTPI